MKNAAMAPMMTIRMMIPRRLPLSRPVGSGAALGAGVAVGLGLANTTGVTTTWTAVFGLPLVRTGTPASLRHDWPLSTTSDVTT